MLHHNEGKEHRQKPQLNQQLQSLNNTNANKSLNDNFVTELQRENKNKGT